jgi:hypothetical protein
LIANTYENKKNNINWKFQTINRLNNKLNEHSTPFKLRIEQFTYYNHEHDTRIFEPNSKGFIKNVRIYNEGEMPSPSNQNIIIPLTQTSNIIPDNSFFNLNKSILHNKSLILKHENFKFSIKIMKMVLKIQFLYVLRIISHSIVLLN